MSEIMSVFGAVVYSVIALWVIIMTQPYYGVLAIPAGALWPAYFAIVMILPARAR